MASTSQRSRERAEARRREIAERQRREARRRLLLRIFLPVALVVVVVAVFVVVKVASGPSKAPDGVLASGSAPASVVTQVTTIPTSAYDTAGVGDDVKGPTPVDGGAALTADGKPRVLYVGGEFCPFCAAERWVVVASLSRFGTFSDLGQTNSAADDSYPNTATLSFHGSSYTSQYLVFDGYETTDRDHQPLDTLPAADQALLEKTDTQGSIPFQDLGGKFSQVGASYDPSLLQGRSHGQIAAAVADPTTAIGKAVLAASNLYTARLCQLTGGQPGAVCTSSGVTAAASAPGS